MKVQVRGRPIFYFHVSITLVHQLMGLSKRHYDGECQRASARVGRPLQPGTIPNQPVNGILTIWIDRFEKDFKPGDEIEVQATWDQLDLIAKICEGAYWDAQYILALKFKSQITEMIQKIGPIMTNQWTTEFDV